MQRTEARKRGRRRRDEAHALPAVRVIEAEDVRMQCEAAERIGRRAVHAVAGDRMPDAREMHADLVAPPRLEAHLQQRVPRAALHLSLIHI